MSSVTYVEGEKKEFAKDVHPFIHLDVSLVTIMRVVSWFIMVQSPL